MPVVQTPAPRRRPRPAAALLAAATLVVLAAAPAALAAPGDVEITFASDTTWTVTDSDLTRGPDLTLPAAAQLVCLNASNPNPCPPGATEYGWGGGGWGTDLSSIPGAAWIWAPGITGSTTPSDGDAYEFAKTITIPGTPTGGSISVAVDDTVDVYVNDTFVGESTGAGLATFDITAMLVSGPNTIVVDAANWVICNQLCSFASNPAGVVFGGAITYTPAAEPTPTPTPSATPAPTPTATPEGTVAPTLQLTPPPTSTGGGEATGASAGGVALLLAFLAAVLLAGTATRARRPR